MTSIALSILIVSDNIFNKGLFNFVYFLGQCTYKDIYMLFATPTKFRNCVQNNGHFSNPSKIIAYACRNISQQIGMQGIRNVRRMKSALIP